MGHRYAQLQAHQSSVSLHVAALLGIPWHALAVATAHRADEIFVGDEHGTLGFAIDPTAYSAHDAFMFKGANAVMWATGVRLASLVRHKSGEIMYFTRSSLVASIGGVIVVNPTPKQVDAMRPNIDYFLLTPSREKPDAWGEIHCPHPIVLTYHDEPGDAGAWLRQLLTKYLCSDEALKTTPLFSDAQGRPYTHAFLDRMLKWVLERCFGAAAAWVYTWHSHRVGLATRFIQRACPTQ